MPPHGHGHHGAGQRWSRSPGAIYYATPTVYPICLETTVDKDGNKTTKQVYCNTQIPGYPSYGLGDALGDNFGDGVVDLWQALKNLSAKIPAADPGPQPTPGNATQQMLNALGAVASTVPGIPSDVKTALRLMPYGAALLSAAQQAQIASIIQSAAPTLARVVSAYAIIAHGPGSGGSPIFPLGTIASYENGTWRIAVPKGSPGFAGSGDLGIGVGQLVAGSYKEVGTAPTMPANATSVTATDFKKATSTPFYKAWWFWTPIGVATAGTVGYFYLRRRKKRR